MSERAAAPALPRRRADHQPARRHRAAPELPAGRLVYLETDPVQLQIELHDGVADDARLPRAALRASSRFAENLGAPDCALPRRPTRFGFLPTRQPVVLDLWAAARARRHERASRRRQLAQAWRDVRYQRRDATAGARTRSGASSCDLPRPHRQPFELALSGYQPARPELLSAHGWRVRAALRLRRRPRRLPRLHPRLARRVHRRQGPEHPPRAPAGSATAARPTSPPAGRSITQDTGFGDVLPTGEGLFAVHDLDDAVAAVEAIAADPAAPRARRRRDRARALRRRARARPNCCDLDVAHDQGRCGTARDPTHPPAARPRAALGTAIAACWR